MAADHRNSSQAPQSLLIAAAVLLALVSGITGIVHHAAELGPQVGDLVAFDPAHLAPFDSSARLTANRLDQGSCVLDVTAMQRSGGSLVLERRGSGPNRLYRAHWSGFRTSNDTQNCGSDADLVLSQIDIDTLATAAGGFGVDHATLLPGVVLGR
jgi:hypothetical protein